MMYRLLWQHRKRYLILQMIVFMLIFLYSLVFNIEDSIELFRILSIWNILIYMYVFFYELKYSNSFHPFILFALIAIQYIGFSAYSMVGVLTSGEEVFFGTTCINDSLVEGLIFLSLEHFLIFSGYYWIAYKKGTSDRHNLLSLFEQFFTYQNIQVAFINYAIVWIFRIIGHFVFSWTSISSFLAVYADRGYLITLTYLLFAAVKYKKPKYVIYYWGVAIIEIVLALRQGMKTVILTPLIPYFIYLVLVYQKDRKLKLSRLMALVLLAFFVIGFVFPYISIFRELSSQYGGDWSQVSTTETLDLYQDYILSEGQYGNFNKESDKGMDYFMSRAGSVGSNAFSIHYVKHNGHVPEYILYAATGIIPRIIWRDKPEMRPGGIAYQFALGETSFDAAYVHRNDNPTSFTIGFIGGAYFSLGMIGALIFPFIAGAFTMKVWLFIKNYIITNPIATWIFYTLIMSILFDYENFIDAGINFYVATIVFCALFSLFKNGKYIRATKAV